MATPLTFSVLDLLPFIQPPTHPCSKGQALRTGESSYSMNRFTLFEEKEK